MIICLFLLTIYSTENTRNVIGSILHIINIDFWKGLIVARMVRGSTHFESHDRTVYDIFMYWHYYLGCTCKNVVGKHCLFANDCILFSFVHSVPTFWIQWCTLVMLVVCNDVLIPFCDHFWSCSMTLKMYCKQDSQMSYQVFKKWFTVLVNCLLDRHRK